MPGTLRSGNPKLNAIDDVVIDESGKFKYILCKVYDSEKPEENKHIVRGTSRAEFHGEILLYIINAQSASLRSFCVLWAFENVMSTVDWNYVLCTFWKMYVNCRLE